MSIDIKMLTVAVLLVINILGVLLGQVSKMWSALTDITVLCLVVALIYCDFKGVK